MAHAEKCPICLGTGRNTLEKSVYAPPLEDVCHGCFGNGRVEVADEQQSGYWLWPVETITKEIGEVVW